LTVVDTTLISAVTRDKDNPIAVGTSQALIAARPSGTLGQTENVARAAVFLASEDAPWITGLPLVIDGGYTVQ
jgi:NAD(P)-dependent dehydrogenase (short-subunit alcohol dehydrogenase family)